MTRGVRWYLVSSLVLVALIVLAGCSHYLLAERESWRHEAELTCLNSGAVKETPERVRISPINGPGSCGMDYPIRVSALGDSAPLGYDDEALRPPGGIPDAATMARRAIKCDPVDCASASAGRQCVALLFFFASRRTAAVSAAAPIRAAAIAADGASRSAAVARPARPAADRRQ